MIKSMFLGVLLACTGGMLLDQSPSVPAEYSFKIGINYDLTSSGKTNQMTSWYSGGNTFAMSAGGRNDMLMVYDMNSKQAVTFMTAQKMYMVMDIEKLKARMAKSAKPETPKDVKVTKTGVKENIAGYPCEQWQILSADTKTLVWISNAVGVDNSNLGESLAMLLQTSPGAAGLPDMKGLGKGVMLKLESTSLKDNKTMTMTATSVNKQGLTFKTAGFKGMVMPG